MYDIVKPATSHATYCVCVCVFLLILVQHKNVTKFRKEVLFYIFYRWVSLIFPLLLNFYMLNSWLIGLLLIFFVFGI